MSKEPVQIEKSNDDYIEERQVESDDENTVKEKTDRVKDKLKKGSDKSEKRKAKPEPEPETKQEDSDSDSDEFTNELERERKLKRQKKA